MSNENNARLHRLKKMKLHKVSENYCQCCSLLDIVYEEVFRVLFFTYLTSSSHNIRVTLSEEESSHRELECISIATNFNKYISDKIQSTTDRHMKILLCFYKITSLFKLYQQSMATGDVVMIEKVELQFCGIFLLLDKSNYVEIILSQMEKKYKECDYHQLHEIRINSTSRYDKDPENKSFYCHHHVLDKTMENVNMWVKSLPLGDDQESWAIHSPNVTVAQRCRLFDSIEYKRGLTNFEKLLEDGTHEYREYDTNKYVPPKSY